MSQSIACHLHDHLEVACLYRYELEVALRNGTTLTARAVTTKTINGQEYLVTQSDAGNHDIPMTEIATLKVLTENAMFSALEFS